MDGDCGFSNHVLPIVFRHTSAGVHRRAHQNGVWARDMDRKIGHDLLHPPQLFLVGVGFIDIYGLEKRKKSKALGNPFGLHHFGFGVAIRRFIGLCKYARASSNQSFGICNYFIWCTHHARFSFTRNQLIFFSDLLENLILYRIFAPRFAGLYRVNHGPIAQLVRATDS